MMLKLGKRGKNWRRRYLVLTDCLLMYFETKNVCMCV